MQGNIDDEQARKNPPVKGTPVKGDPDPSPGRSVVRGIKPPFRSAVVSRPPDVLPLSLAGCFFPPAPDVKPAETTASRHEDKPKVYPISRDYVSYPKPGPQPPVGGPVWERKISQKDSGWNMAILIKLPRYFPLERTNRSIKLEECSLEKILSQLAVGFRVMSIQAKYFDKPASAALLAPENVELYLALWESDNEKEVIVEVQRRRGDTLIFHQYANRILDSASGTLDPSDSFLVESSLLYLQSAQTKLEAELSRVALETKDMEKESVFALEVVCDLLKKDRRDARRLGMEGVCILANARKTCLPATILTSRALLLGDQDMTSKGLHNILLGIIQKRSMGDDDEVNMGEFAVADDENFFPDDDDLLKNYTPEYKEEMSLLLNLALDALAHALEVATTFELVSPSDDSSFSPNVVVDTFLVLAMKCTEMDMLVTLLETLRRADIKPHNAWLACKCLRFICAASPDAAQRLCNLGGMEFVEEALDVGEASHAKLESESRLLQGILTS